MATVVGAFIALLGVALTTWLQGRRERERREHDARQALVTRVYGDRRDALLAFLTEAERLTDPEPLQALRQREREQHDAADVLDERLGPLYVRVDVFASSEAAEAARALATAISTYVSKETPELWTDTVNALDEYRTAVRRDIGVAS